MLRISQHCCCLCNSHFEILSLCSARSRFITSVPKQQKQSRVPPSSPLFNVRLLNIFHLLFIHSILIKRSCMSAVYTPFRVDPSIITNFCVASSLLLSATLQTVRSSCRGNRFPSTKIFERVYSVCCVSRYIYTVPAVRLWT